MKNPFFKGDRQQQSKPADIPPAGRRGFQDPTQYYPDQGLIDAVNVALMVGQPLLLTGEPGTGKSMLAHYLAWELNYGDVLTFETKSTSQASDLFYIYDAITHFRHAQTGVEKDIGTYITLNALGQAILKTLPKKEYQKIASPPKGSPAYKPSRSVVLIDEIDKAPRDFPNDILNEIDRLFFRIRELDNEPIKADPALAPIIILTSNSEKDLPDAFLRRCIFHHIEFPQRDTLQQIVAGRLGNRTKGSSAFYDKALDLFFELRKDRTLRKKPATAELLDWMLAMHNTSGGHPNPLTDDPNIALQTISSLIKTTADRDRAKEIASKWIKAQAVSNES